MLVTSLSVFLTDTFQMELLTLMAVHFITPRSLGGKYLTRLKSDGTHGKVIY